MGFRIRHLLLILIRLLGLKLLGFCLLAVFLTALLSTFIVGILYKNKLLIEFFN